MEKPITRTTFLHDIGLFVEKYLSASSIKGVQAFRLSLYALDSVAADIFAGHGASANDCPVIQLGRLLPQIRPSCIRNHQNIQFWMTVRSLLGYFRPELSVKASLLGKVDE